MRYEPDPLADIVWENRRTTVLPHVRANWRGLADQRSSIDLPGLTTIRVVYKKRSEDRANPKHTTEGRDAVFAVALHHKAPQMKPNFEVVSA